MTEKTEVKSSKNKNGKIQKEKMVDEVQLLFNSLTRDNENSIDVSFLQENLTKNGILRDDPRLKSFFTNLKSYYNNKTILELEEFRETTKECFSIMRNALSGELVIPNFEKFTEELKDIFKKVKKNKNGKVADYIPQLKKVPADKFGISVCTIDGQRWSAGDSEEFFSIQSACKPLNYCLAVEEHGEEKVHQHVGSEPSGHSFNEITLDPKKRPHNPMINAGAIMTSSLVKPDLCPADRFEYVLKNWTKICGGSEPRFNNSVYLSELGTADRNFALAYFMKEHGTFPKGTDLQETLEFYFQCCSIDLTAEQVAVAASTMALSGLCPLTGEKVFKSNTLKNTLALMSTCGMYDYSGEFFFKVGFPAKSGVGGGLLIVIPNVMGICVWSPALDQNGNSVRGIDFCKELVNKYALHNYDSLAREDSKKTDPRKNLNELKTEYTTNLISAAHKGDLEEIRRYLIKGVDINQGDYDGRTALHLASAEGHTNCVRLLLSKGAKADQTDRWGSEPIVDAKNSGHHEIVKILESYQKEKKVLN